MIEEKHGFKVGQRVKVVPPDFPYLSKGGFLLHSVTQESKGKLDPHIMLGGEYTIKEVDDKGLLHLDVVAKDGWGSRIGFDAAIPVDEVQYCPFQVGDLVKVSANASEINVFYGDFEYFKRNI